MPAVEYKGLALVDSRIKLAGDSGLTFSGYASTFNNVDSYGDMIDPGAYDDTLKNRERPIRLRWNHWGPVIGKLPRIETDEVGLSVDGSLTPGHSVAMDAAASLKHESINGLSIGYYDRESEMIQHGEQGRTIRLLKKIELLEISVVEEPADLGAQIDTVKTMLTEADELRDIETVLRKQYGISQTGATAIVSAVSRVLKRRDGEKAKHSELVKLIESMNY